LGGWNDRERRKEKMAENQGGNTFFFPIFAPDFLLLSRHEILIYL
jgi:hypothetical protein